MALQGPVYKSPTCEAYLKVLRATEKQVGSNGFKIIPQLNLSQTQRSRAELKLPAVIKNSPGHGADLREMCFE